MKKLVEIALKPLWSQMDALGHINNAVYFSYCEETRLAFFNAIGLGDALAGKSETGPVIINATCVFLKPVVYPCTLQVSMYCGEIGNSSFMAHYEIKCNGELFTTGQSKVVWVNYSEGKSIPLPQAVRKHLE